MFVINLSVSDISLFTTQALPVTINAIAGGTWIFGPLICRIYACLGGIFGKTFISKPFSFPIEFKHGLLIGTVSALSLLLIGYDRYNVIVKGINGFRMTYGGSVLFILAIWIYSIIVCVPPFFGWGEYALGKTRFLIP